MIKLANMNKTNNIQLEIKEIIYVEAYRNTIDIYTIHGIIHLQERFGSFMRRYPAHEIVRIHHAYAINLRYLYDFDDHDVFLLNFDIRLPIGISYETAFRESYYHYIYD